MRESILAYRGSIGLVVGMAIMLSLVLATQKDTLPDCVKGAPEDVVVYRSEVPGKWDSCAPADDLVGDQSWVDR